MHICYCKINRHIKFSKFRPFKILQLELKCFHKNYQIQIIEYIHYQIKQLYPNMFVISVARHELNGKNLLTFL